MQYSRSPFVTWGKEIISAIDLNHGGRLIHTYKSKKHLGADMDAQTTKTGYGGYSWTVYIHNFLGDTAMHLALRQKKFVCAHALLVLGARTDIRNDAGITQEEMIFELTGKTLTLFRRESERELVCGMNPYDLHLLPDNIVYRGIDRQSWNLMLDGRNEYTKLPENAEKLTNPPFESDVAQNTQEQDGQDGQLATASVLEQDENRSTDGDEGGKNYLKAVMDKHTNSLGLLASSVGSISSYEKADTNSAIRENGFCFNDIRDVEEFVKSQNVLLFRLDREERLKVSGLSLLKTNDAGDTQNEEDDGDKSVASIAQNLMKNAAKSFKNFKYLQRAMAIEETEEKKTCLDMPYRHLTKLSTHTNMIHMNIGDQGLRRVCRHLPGNYMITDIVLANARITSRGLRFLCDALTFMDNIFYLDLSQNCIDDRGMEYLSDLLGEGNLSSCPSLRKITLMGNRITFAGAKLVASSALSGTLEYLNLCNNLLEPDEVAELKDLVKSHRNMNVSDEKIEETQKNKTVRSSTVVVLCDNLLKRKPLCGYGGF